MNGENKTLEKRKTLLASLKFDGEDLLDQIKDSASPSQIEIVKWAYNQRIRQIELEICKLKKK